MPCRTSCNQENRATSLKRSRELSDSHFSSRLLVRLFLSKLLNQPSQARTKSTWRNDSYQHIILSPRNLIRRTFAFRIVTEKGPTFASVSGSLSRSLDGLAEDESTSHACQPTVEVFGKQSSRLAAVETTHV